MSHAPIIIAEPRVRGRRDCEAFWDAIDLNYLCDLIADGHSFGQIATAMGRSRSSCCSAFRRIRLGMGRQGQ